MKAEQISKSGRLQIRGKLTNFINNASKSETRKENYMPDLYGRLY